MNINDFESQFRTLSSHNHNKVTSTGKKFTHGSGIKQPKNPAKFKMKHLPLYSQTLKPEDLIN